MSACSVIDQFVIESAKCGAGFTSIGPHDIEVFRDGDLVYVKFYYNAKCGVVVLSRAVPKDLVKFELWDLIFARFEQITFAADSAIRKNARYFSVGLSKFCIEEDSVVMNGKEREHNGTDVSKLEACCFLYAS